jgi:rhomboid family GlyGly-CTERM serine protease
MSPGRARLWWLPLCIVTICGLLQFGAPALGESLRLAPGMIRDGELWRLLSGHLLHLSWGHYLMNGAALLVICGLYASWLTAGTLACWMAVSALAVSVGLLWFEPQLDWYVGLSGVLHGLLVAGALYESSQRERMGMPILIAVGLKLAWEQAYGSLPGSEAATGGAVIVDAHLYGAVGGLIAVAGHLLTAHWSRLRSMPRR